MDEIKFESGSMITAFISPRIKFDVSSDSEEEKKDDKNDKDVEVTNFASVEPQNPLNIVRDSDERGFDLFKIRGYSVNFTYFSSYIDLFLGC